MAAWGKISLGPEYTTVCMHVTHRHSGLQILKVTKFHVSNKKYLLIKLKTLELLYEMWIHFNGIGSSGVKWHRYKKSTCLGLPQLGNT